MPVVVTGAAGRIGRGLTPLLAERGEVRAVVDDQPSAERLRSAGAKVAVASLQDPAVLRAIMDGAHTVIHLAGEMNLPDEAAYELAHVETTRAVLEAATDASIVRFLFLSYPGASPQAQNAFLRVKGLAEEAVESAGVDHLILRSTLIYGPGQRWFEDLLAAAARPLGIPVVGTGRQRVAPVHVRDVTAALLAADDRADPVSGTLGLQGPEVLTMDELMDLVAGRVRRKVHVPPASAARAGRLFGRPLYPALLEILAADSIADARDASGVLGLQMTKLEDGLGDPSVVTP